MMFLTKSTSLQAAASTARTARCKPCLSPTCRRSLPSPACTAVADKARHVPSDIKSIIFSEEQVRHKVQELAGQITRDYTGKKLVVLGVLNGAYIFTADLTRYIGLPKRDIQVDFVKASSYGSESASTGTVQVNPIGDSARWQGTHVLLVEDIIDSGHTLNRLAQELTKAGAASVKVAALLDKKGRRRVDFCADYVGFECPDEFIVGYGLDYNEQYRCLPYVAALKPEAYS